MRPKILPTRTRSRYAWTQLSNLGTEQRAMPSSRPTAIDFHRYIFSPGFGTTPFLALSALRIIPSALWNESGQGTNAGWRGHQPKTRAGMVEWGLCSEEQFPKA